jgi:hypothetical protein
VCAVVAGHKVSVSFSHARSSHMLQFNLLSPLLVLISCYERNFCISVCCLSSWKQQKFLLLSIGLNFSQQRDSNFSGKRVSSERVYWNDDEDELCGCIKISFKRLEFLMMYPWSNRQFSSHLIKRHLHAKFKISPLIFSLSRGFSFQVAVVVVNLHAKMRKIITANYHHLLLRAPSI